MCNQNQNGNQGVAVSPMKRFNAAIASTQMQDYLQSVLGAKKNSFVNNVVALVSNNTALQACSPMSIIYASLKATALDLPLDPNLGFAYVIPYNSKEGQVAQFQIGYRGFIQLAIRTGLFANINVAEVHEGELKSRDIITGKLEFEAVADREKKPVIGYVAYIELLSGFSKMLYMTYDEVNAHALRYSQTYKSKYESTRKSSKWTTDFDAMAKKTVLKLLLSKWAPLSVETPATAALSNAINRDDQAVFGEDGTQSFADNPEEQEQPTGDEKKEALREKIANSDVEQPKLL